MGIFHLHLCLNGRSFGDRKLENFRNKFCSFWSEEVDVNAPSFTSWILLMGGNTAIQRVFCPLCCNACSSRAVERDVAAPQPHGVADYGAAYAVFVFVFFFVARYNYYCFFFFLWRVQINCFGKLSSLGNTVNPCDTCIISITVRLLLAPRFTSVLPPSPLNPAFFIRFLCGIFGEILESETGA